MYPALYDAALAFFEALGLRRWRKSVVRRARGRVLEIGAGTGRNLRYYRAIDHITVTDPDPAMLNRARLRSASLPVPVEIVPADAQSLPFGDESFDTVVSTFVFCSMADPQAAFAEIYRLLKPGGMLEMLEHVRATRSWAARLQDILTPGWMHLADNCRLNRRTLETALACGFEPVRVRRGLDGWLLAASLRRSG